MRAGRPRSHVVCIAAVCAMRITVSREHRLLEQGHGATGLPHAPTRGRVWEGVALPRSMFIPSVCGGAAWMAKVKMGGWGTQGRAGATALQGPGAVRINH